MSIYKWGKTVPEFVKNYRAANGLSQEDLAKRLKVHGQYVSNVERGTHRDPITFCSKMGKLLPQDQWQHLVSLIADSKAETISEQMDEVKRTTKLRRASVKKD